MKSRVALLLSDVRRGDKANLDYKAKITVYAYLLYNKAIRSYHYSSLLLLLLSSLLFYHKPMVYETLKILSVA